MTKLTPPADEAAEIRRTAERLLTQPAKGELTPGEAIDLICAGADPTARGRGMDGFDKDICPICGEPAPNGTPAGAAHLETHSREELIASTLDLRDRLEAAVEQVMQLGRRP